MTRPPLPTSAEMKRSEDAAPGGAKQLFDLYCISLQNYERRMDEASMESRRDARHLRLYRYFSVLSGMLLAISSLGLCAFGIERKADLLLVAGVLGPVAGLAGVFIWGYRPRAQSSIEHTGKITNEDISERA